MNLCATRMLQGRSMRAKPSHAYNDFTTSQLTNLQQTALNCCQPLSAPYKRFLNQQEKVTHCLLFILQPIYSHNSAHVFRANHIARSPTATLSIDHLTLKMTSAWLWKHQSPTTVLPRTPITQMIIFNPGMLLLESNNYFIYHHDCS